MKIGAVDIIIPTYMPDNTLDTLLAGLITQTRVPNRIILMNTRADGYNVERYNEFTGVEVHDIDKKSFDHGGTRDAAARISNADIMVFMTQDAVPADSHLIDKLLEPFDDDRVGAAYARQLPRDDCHMIERYIRSYNYPDQDQMKSLDDLPKLGIKTYFCSDVCAAYRRDLYTELGGFESPAIFNEDMILASKIIGSGHTIYYASGALVIHSHNYTNMQQYRRNFDLAVSQADHPEIFSGIPSEKEGKRLVLSAARYVMKAGRPWLVFPLFVSSIYKYLGYRKGMHYQKLSCSRILHCTANPDFWIS